MRLIFALLMPTFLMMTACTKSGKGSGSSAENFIEILGSEPADLHPIRANELVSTQIVQQHTYYTSSIVESLAYRDLDTYELKPGLAVSWEVSPDEKEFTFKLREGVKFHDGSEFTAEDVKFSFDAINDDLFEAYVARSFYKRIKKAEVVDKYTVKFTAAQPYFQNLDILAELVIVPKATYGKQTKDRRLAKTVVGSGPYKFAKWNKGQSITLEAFPDWWGNKVKGIKERYNFKRIVFKFIKEKELRRAMMERGKGDYEYGVSSENFVKKMNDKPWGDTVLKVKVENKVPKSLSFIGWNNKNKIFKDKKVRKALAYLVNRDFINEKFYYGMNDKATGPFRIGGDYANPNIKPIPYDPEKAKEILTAAGWADSDKDGLLDKVIDGEKVDFRFNLLSANKDSEKIITVIKEDMKKAGVQLDIENVDWTAFTKALNERKFDAVIMAWGGGGVDPDPTQIWHSKSAEGTGSNFVSYVNPEVDKLIEEGIKIKDKAARIKAFHKIHALIAEDQPYMFYFEPKYQLYAVSARVQRPKDTYKYSIGPQYWSLPAKAE